LFRNVLSGFENEHQFRKSRELQGRQQSMFGRRILKWTAGLVSKRRVGKGWERLKDKTGEGKRS
jgi:hypothetical protein